jgi:hypothetical protein
VTKHRETFRELTLTDLKKNVEPSLRAKGFDVEFVESEGVFIQQLESGKHDVAWVISGSALNVGLRYKRKVQHAAEEISRLALACLQFHQQGKGLFLLGENEPLYCHVNAILQAMACDALKLHGNNPGDRFITVDDSKCKDGVVRERLSPGRFSNKANNHPLTTGLATLYEGKTIAFPRQNGHELPLPWHALAVGGTLEESTARPISMYRGDVSGNKCGRVVVDTGYTKLWLNWGVGGTERYVCNTTAWLTAIDRTLKDIDRTTHPTVDQLRLPRRRFEGPRGGDRGQVNVLMKEISASLPMGFDVILVVDMSGSMSPHFDKAKEFCFKMVQAFKIDVPGSCNRMGLIPFGTTIGHVSALGSSAEKLSQDIAAMKNLTTTNFAPPLNRSRDEFRDHGVEGQTRLVIFQTDGDNWDSAEAVIAARSLVNGDSASGGGAKVYGIAVGAGQAGVASITGEPGFFDAHTIDKKISALVRTLTTYDELVQEVDSIVKSASAQ